MWVTLQWWMGTGCGIWYLQYLERGRVLLRRWERASLGPLSPTSLRSVPTYDPLERLGSCLAAEGRELVPTAPLGCLKV